MMATTLETVYSFDQDKARIEAMQKASSGPTDFGVSVSPALVGTPQWWRATRDGTMPRTIITGTISHVFWGSMGDWPECQVTADDGTTSTWTREGDLTRYVEGLRVRIAFVEHPWKVPDRPGRGAASRIVLTVEIEDSAQRSDRHAPGPGGIGLRRKT